MGAELRNARHRATQTVMGLNTAGPMADHCDLLAGAGHGDDDAFQHQSRDRLPIGGRSGGSGPERRNILGEAADGHLLVGRQGSGLICQEVIIVGRETKLRRQRLLPALLQRAGDQPVLRLDGIILPARSSTS